jgi:xylan 1,4-beta-xylosidase
MHMLKVPSEDPYINGQFGVGYTKGLQEGDDPRYVQAISTLKHWDAYSLEDADGFTRHDFDAQVSNFSLADTYWPAFKASVVEGGALGAMCSYNAVNGVPTCASPLLDSVLRGQWNFSGYVTSDTGAVSDIYQKHKYRSSGEGATCAALHDGGCDIDSGGVYHSHLLSGVQQGKCSMDDVKRALRRTLG